MFCWKGQAVFVCQQENDKKLEGQQTD